MYDFLHNLLSDKKCGEIFTLFSAWHFFYIFIATLIIVVFIISFRNKEEIKHKSTNILINIAFGLYVADFFLMPLAYGRIDIEKLPFHACTAMCVMCFLCNYCPFLNKYKISFVMLGFISNIVYLIYPAGVMWYAVHPLSYRVVQTMLFHCLMSAYTFLYMVFEYRKIDIRKCYRDFIIIICMVVWALIGNYAYNGTSDGYSYFFNWFFVIRDPLYIIPETVSPYIMPFLNITVFFTAEILIHSMVWKIRRIVKH